MSWWQRSAMMGILAGLAFPPLPSFFALLLIPAFWGWIRIAEESPSARAAMMRVYPGLLVWNIAATYWLAMATVGGGVAAILANAVVMSVPFGLYRRFRTEQDSILRQASLFITLWIAFEWFHHKWDLAWPWLTIGNAFSNATAFIQFIEFTGVLGISAWVLAGVFALRHIRIHPVPASIVILLPAVVSLAMVATMQEKQVGHISTLIVQPNFDSYAPLSGFDSEAEVLENLLQITDSNVEETTELILWPENSMEGWVYPDPNRYPNPHLTSHAALWNSTLIGGATFFKPIDASTDIPEPYRYTGNGTAYTIYNAGVAWNPDGTLQVYGKRRLVPIVERFPFVSAIAKVTPWFDWTGLMGYGKGIESANLDVGPHVVTGLVCYDSVFPDWVRTQVRDGADVVGIITNDGWWGDTSGHEQHFAFARLRAIETRRAVVRSANNGISGIILPDGSVTYRSDYWTRTTHHADIPIFDRMTIYVRFGDWVIGLILAIALAISFVWTPRRSA